MGRRNHDEDDNKSENAEIRKSLVLSGSVGSIFMGVPYLVLGKDSVFVYHDQLDGEVIAYLLQARHLWDGSSVLPEFMNGAAKTALTMPAPACVLLYRWLPAELALACMQVLAALPDIWECSACLDGPEKHRKHCGEEKDLSVS